jgi:predicted  nucleic acid-binding Zn-ribbon protein
VDELTDWIDGTVVPVRDGVYERDINLLQGHDDFQFARYESGVWYMSAPTVDEAAEAICYSDFQAGAEFTWRGRANP